MVTTHKIIQKPSHYRERVSLLDVPRQKPQYSSEIINKRALIYFYACRYAEFLTWSYFCPWIYFFRVCRIWYPSCLFFIQQVQLRARKRAPRHKITLSSPGYGISSSTDRINRFIDDSKIWHVVEIPEGRSNINWRIFISFYGHKMPVLLKIYEYKTIGDIFRPLAWTTIIKS